MRWVFVAGHDPRRGLFTRRLRREGFRVTAMTGPHMISEGILARPHDCVVLIGLPHQEVLNVARSMHSAFRALNAPGSPLLALPSQEAFSFTGPKALSIFWVEQDIDDGLLLAHMRALIRRKQGYPSHHRFGKLGLDLEKSRASLDGHPLALRPMEFNLLSLLIEARGRPIPSTVLSQHLWPDQPCHHGRLVVHIHHLRKQLSGRNAGIRVQHFKSMGYALSMRMKDAGQGH